MYRVELIKVAIPDDGSDMDPLGVGCVKFYEEAIIHHHHHHHQEQGHEQNKSRRPRAILISNPHNPLGRPYPADTLLALLHLAQKYQVHLISDEIYAAHSFPSRDIPSLEDPDMVVPFTSILSFDLTALGINPALVHVVYSMSKDFCANGLRLGVIVTQNNADLIRAIGAISKFSWPSPMAEQVWTNMLTDHDFLTMYQRVFRERMRQAYDWTTALLTKEGIGYQVCYAGPYLWIDLRKFLDVENSSEDGGEENLWKRELDLAFRLVRKGKVCVSPGQQYDAMTPGKFRLTFAMEQEELQLGMERMLGVLKGSV